MTARLVAENIAGIIVKATGLHVCSVYAQNIVGDDIKDRNWGEQEP